MNIFRRPDYASEFTQFLDDLKVKNPALEAQQLAGRSIWWDKKNDRSADADYASARVSQQPYVYQTSGHSNSK